MSNIIILQDCLHQIWIYKYKKQTWEINVKDT